MLRLIYSTLAVVVLVGVSSGFAGRITKASVLNVPQVADGTAPEIPPLLSGPQVADGPSPDPIYPLAA